MVRVKQEDDLLLKKIAKYYGISKADVIRIALMEWIKAHGLTDFLTGSGGDTSS